MSIKEITNAVYESLKDDGFFNNEFIDEGKFKLRFFNEMNNIANKTDSIDADSVLDIAFNVSNQIMLENIDKTVSELTDMGLVESVVNEDGEIAYKLKEN